MNKRNNLHDVYSPTREVWRTQIKKGDFIPSRVSRITCVVNRLFSDQITECIFKLGLGYVFVESGRTIRELIQTRKFGLPGSIIKNQSTSVDVFRFTVQRKDTRLVTDYLINTVDLNIPGRGTIFSQDLIEFSKKEPVLVSIPEYENKTNHNISYSDKLSYVVCILSIPGMGEKLAKVALELGICVPLITHGESSDLRDQLGLIRITIPPEKEVVHLIMPEQDTDSIIKLLLEEGRLDRPGSGYIYRTPVSYGLLDTRLRIGKQDYAASIEQIIAALDQLKGNTMWRKRFDTFESENINKKLWHPDDNCELSLIIDEDHFDILRNAGIKAGATASTVSNIKLLMASTKKQKVSSLVKGTFSVSAHKTNDVVDALLQNSAIGLKFSERLQVLDSPAAYIKSL